MSHNHIHFRLSRLDPLIHEPSPAVGLVPRRGSIALGLALLCLVAAGAQNAFAETIVVHSTADSGPGSLRQALADAADGDKINIVASGTITLTSGELVVNKSLEIKGHGADRLSINGNGAGRVFHVMPGTTVTISGIRIANGRAGGFRFPESAGGGIYSDHAQFTLRDCIVSGNTARFGGGVFSNSYGGGSASLTLVNTTIRGNSAEFVLSGDLIRGFGGGVFSGGGFSSANPSGDATLSLDNSVVSGNTAAFGGGIFNDGFSGSATATINNSSVTNNTAVPGDAVLGDQFITVGGGGIYNNGDSGVANLALTNSTVSGNVSGVFVEDPTEEHPAGEGNGGGIYNDGIASVRPGNAQVTLDNTSVSGNTAFGDFPGSHGGAIYNEGRDLGRAVVTANNSNFNDNRADEGGGGIFNNSWSGEATISLTGSAVNGNSSRSTGGIVNVRFISESHPDTLGNASLTLVSTVVRENSGFEAITNSGATLTITNCDVSDNLGAGIVTFTGALPSVATISGSVISRNRSSGEGGGILNYANGGATSTLQITGSIIRENYASISGGGIANFVGIGAATLTMDKSTVSNNHAVTGGGILNDALAGTATATITNSTLSGNSTQGELPPGGFSDGGGGGVLNGRGATLELTNCTVSGNSTHRTGGGIGNYASRVTLNNCTLSDNSAAQGGNNIWNKGNTDQPPPEPCPPEGCPPPPPPCPSCPPPPPPCPPNCPQPSNATVDFSNTIFDAGALGDNIQNIGPGIITSRGYNLSSDAAGGDGATGPGGFLNAIGDIRNTNPHLGPLQDNGGPTMTHALLSHSPAIDAGDPNFNPNAFNPPLLYDQRGYRFSRVVNGCVDIGAFELQRAW